MEFEQLVTGNFRVSLGGSYIDAKIDDSFQNAPAGSRMPNVPRYTMNAGIVESFPLPENLQGSVRADFSYRDGSFDNLPNIPWISPPATMPAATES